jgi:cell wall-associated NlpC family hydrolase
MAALRAAESQLGTPYRWGGSSPSAGFDCSGLVQWAYGKVGIHIPRVTDQQILAGTPVDRKSLLPGDLVFFRDSTGYVHHVGMSLGGDKFVNAPHTGADVRINSLKEPYFAQQFTGGRRFDRAVAAAHRVSADARFLPAVKRSQLPER